MYWATEAQISEGEWKEELYRKSSVDVQEKSMKERFDVSLPFQAFAAHCNQMAIGIEQLNNALARRSRVRGQNRGAVAPVNSVNAAALQSDGSVKRTKLTDAARTRLIAENKCFYCRNPGHMLYQCPSHPRALQAKVNVKSVEFEDPPAAEEDGKESP